MPSIYLSPSMQPYDLYPNGGDEQYWMNKIADAMVPLLEDCGVACRRNTPNTSTSAAIRESNASGCSLHLVLHSKSAPPEMEGKIKGPVVYYYEYSRSGKQAADLFAENLRKVYPEPDLLNVAPATDLAELSRTDAPAVLVELAYHDNPQDEVWITANTDSIARSLARSAAEFLGVIFPDA